MSISMTRDYGLVSQVGHSELWRTYSILITENAAEVSRKIRKKKDGWASAQSPL
jgi:hypothetical protein